MCSRNGIQFLNTKHQSEKCEEQTALWTTAVCTRKGRVIDRLEWNVSSCTETTEGWILRACCQWTRWIWHARMLRMSLDLWLWGMRWQIIQRWRTKADLRGLAMTHYAKANGFICRETRLKVKPTRTKLSIHSDAENMFHISPCVVVPSVSQTRLHLHRHLNKSHHCPLTSVLCTVKGFIKQVITSYLRLPFLLFPHRRLSLPLSLATPVRVQLCFITSPSKHKKGFSSPQRNSNQKF